MIEALWEPFVVPEPLGEPIEVEIWREEDRFPVRVGNEGAFPPSDPWQTLDHLRNVLTHRNLTRRTDLLALHASVLHRDRKALLLVGQPYSGKTTLTVELLERGWSYVSDDLALVDGKGTVLGFPKPLSVRDPDQWKRWRSRWSAGDWLPEPRVVGLIPATIWGKPERGLLGAKWVLFPKFEAGEQSSLERLTSAQASVLCLQNTFNLKKAGPEGVRSTVSMCSDAVCAQLRYPSTTAALELLERIPCP